MKTTVTLDLSTAIHSVRLICVDVARNHNKQWAAWVLPSGDLYSENGRVGYTPARNLKSFGTVSRANQELNKLVSQKRVKGYDFAVVEDQAASGLDFSKLPALYATHIEQQFSALVAQSEQVTAHTAIQFDRDHGVFVTQMGVVSQQTVIRAVEALQNLEAIVTTRPVHLANQPQYIKAVEAYLAIVPLNVGMKLNPQQILGTLNQIQQQFHILEQLQNCLAQISAIRHLISQALDSATSNSPEPSPFGSDERARWLNWGNTAESNPEHSIIATEDDRAGWVQW